MTSTYSSILFIAQFNLDVLEYKEGIWGQINIWIQNWPFYFLLHAPLLHDQLFRKKGDHLVRSASNVNNFCLIWYLLKHPYSRLVISCQLIRIDSSHVTMLYTSFEALPLYFVRISLYLTRQHHFEILSSYVRTNVAARRSCNILNILVELMPKVASNLEYDHLGLLVFRFLSSSPKKEVTLDNPRWRS